MPVSLILTLVAAASVRAQVVQAPVRVGAAFANRVRAGLAWRDAAFPKDQWSGPREGR